MVRWRLRDKDEKTMQNGHESVQVIITLVELLHWKWFVTKFLKNPATIFKIDYICNLQFICWQRDPSSLKSNLGSNIGNIATIVFLNNTKAALVFSCF